MENDLVSAYKTRNGPTHLKRSKAAAKVAHLRFSLVLGSAKRLSHGLSLYVFTVNTSVNTQQWFQPVTAAAALNRVTRECNRCGQLVTYRLGLHYSAGLTADISFSVALQSADGVMTCNQRRSIACSLAFIRS